MGASSQSRTPARSRWPRPSRRVRRRIGSAPRASVFADWDQPFASAVKPSPSTRRRSSTAGVEADAACTKLTNAPSSGRPARSRTRPAIDPAGPRTTSPKVVVIFPFPCTRCCRVTRVHPGAWASTTIQPESPDVTAAGQSSSRRATPCASVATPGRSATFLATRVTPSIGRLLPSTQRAITTSWDCAACAPRPRDSFSSAADEIAVRAVASSVADGSVPARARPVGRVAASVSPAAAPGCPRFDECPLHAHHDTATMPVAASTSAALGSVSRTVARGAAQGVALRSRSSGHIASASARRSPSRAPIRVRNTATARDNRLRTALAEQSSRCAITRGGSSSKKRSTINWRSAGGSASTASSSFRCVSIFAAASSADPILSGRAAARSRAARRHSPRKRCRTTLRSTTSSHRRSRASLWTPRGGRRRALTRVSCTTSSTSWRSPTRCRAKRFNHVVWASSSCGSMDVTPYRMPLLPDRVRNPRPTDEARARKSACKLVLHVGETGSVGVLPPQNERSNIVSTCPVPAVIAGPVLTSMIWV